MNHNLEIQKILLKVEEIKAYEDKVKALKEAIQIADRHNDLDWGFDLRLDLIRNEHNTSKCVESFAAFAWILNATDTHEDYFDESDFLWEYKWMFCSAFRNSSISAEQIDQIGEDLKQRLERNGYSKRAYYNVLTDWYQHRGEFDKAAEAIALADADLVDDMTHCPACELNAKVDNELLMGNIEKALVLGQDLIHKRETCYWMPFYTYVCLMYYMEREGDERASEYYKLALQEYEDNTDYDSSVLYGISMMLYYMSKTQRPEFWDYFQKAAAWEVDAEDIGRFNFAVHVLDAFKNGGRKKLNLSSRIPYYNPEGEYDLKALYHYYYNIAAEFATRFDARNGNIHFKEKMEELV